MLFTKQASSSVTKFPPKLNRRLGYTNFFIAALLYGSFGIIIRELQNYFSACQQIFVRSLGAFFVALLLMSCLVPVPIRKTICEPRVYLFGLIFPFSMFLWTISVTIGTVHSSVFGLYVGALFTSPLLSKILFKEPISKQVLLSLTFALIGVAFFCARPSEEFNYSALALSSLAGVFQAIALCYRRWLGDVNRFVVVFVQSFGGLFLVSAVLILSNTTLLPNVGILPYGMALLYGALVVLISYLLLVGSQNLEIAKGNIILSTELIWAAIFAYLFLGEEPSLYQIVGSGFLFLAMVATIPETRKGIKN